MGNREKSKTSKMSKSCNGCTCLDYQADCGFCFIEPKEDDHDGRFGGFALNLTRFLCCTFNTKHDETALEYTQVKFPRARDLKIRTACCCCHCGCNFDTETCIALQIGSACLCSTRDVICFLFKEDPKYGRAFCRSTGHNQCCQCEGDDCIYAENNGMNMLLCCCTLTDSSGCYCCPARPKPFRISIVQQQICCIYTKVTPFFCCCYDELPFEIACCGAHCLDGRARVEKFENEYPEVFHPLVSEPT